LPAFLSLALLLRNRHAINLNDTKDVYKLRETERDREMESTAVLVNGVVPALDEVALQVEGRGPAQLHLRQINPRDDEMEGVSVSRKFYVPINARKD
jgi:hypothetical protein